MDHLLRELVFLRGGEPAREHVAWRCVLDFGAPDTWPDLPYDTGAPAAWHDAAEQAHVTAVLGRAGATIAACVPRAHALVDTQLQRVLLRRCAGLAGRSTSHRAHVGSCVLTNLQQAPAAVAVAVAVEALTHEAIHQMLYRTEAAEGAFCDLSELPTFRSPWTGARLPLHSLVHASLVWFGLLTLWTALAQRHGDAGALAIDGAHARQRMAHCLFGFAFLDDVLCSPGFPRASVQPQVLDLLHRLTVLTQRATRAADAGATLQDCARARGSASWPASLASVLARAWA